MAPLLDNPYVDLEVRVTPLAVQPARLEPPTSLLLPPTAAGRQHLNPGWIIPTPKEAARKTPKEAARRWRLDWAEIGMIALIPASMMLAIYRLFWAIQP